MAGTGKWKGSILWKNVNLYNFTKFLKYKFRNIEIWDQWVTGKCDKAGPIDLFPSNFKTFGGFV